MSTQCADAVATRKAIQMVYCDTWKDKEFKVLAGCAKPVTCTIGTMKEEVVPRLQQTGSATEKCYMQREWLALLFNVKWHIMLCAPRCFGIPTARQSGCH